MPTGARSIRRTSPRRPRSIRRAARRIPTSISGPATCCIPTTCATSAASRRAAASPGTSAATSSLVIRGGSGLYYSIPDSNTTFSTQSFNGERILVNSFPNDGQPGFIAGSDARPHAGGLPVGPVPAAAAGPARDRARLPDAVDVAEHHRRSRPRSGRSLASRRTSRTGRATTSRASAIRTCSSIRRPATTATRRRAVPIRSTGRSSGSSRTASADYAAISTALTRRYANNWQASMSYTLHAVHERRHQRLPVPGQQPVRSGSGVGALDRLPAAHAARSTGSGACRTTFSCRARICSAPATTTRRRSRSIRSATPAPRG